MSCTIVRPAGMGSLAEAMAQTVEVNGFAELLAHLQSTCPFWKPTTENVKVEHYGYDARTGWDTHLVTVDGNAALFCDGPVEVP
jgi:hypothetical protein